MIKAIAQSFAAVVMFAGVASAATSWSPSAGSTDNTNYSAGQSTNGLFGTPTVGGDSFLFFPSGFEANDSTPSISDTLSFIITAKPGKLLSHISAGLSGDWSILGAGAVDATGTLKITNISTSSVLTQNLTFSPTFPNSAEQGTFTALGNINLPAGWTSAKVELSTALSLVGTQAVAVDVQNGFTGLIQLKGANIDLQTAAVPLPGAVLAAPFAFGVAWIARRRMSRR